MSKVVYRIGIIAGDKTVAYLIGFDESGNAKFTLDSNDDIISFETEYQAQAMSLALCKWSGFEYDILIFSEDE